MAAGETRGIAPTRAQNDPIASRNSPNRVLRGIREERHQSRAEFADAMARVAREIGEEVHTDEKYVARLESGAIAWPRPPIRNVLAKLCDRPVGELGFTRPVLSAGDPAASDGDGSGELVQSRVNVPLRNAIFVSGIEVSQLARKIGVDPKTVERWITHGRIPHARHRWKASQILGRDEFELWPESDIGYHEGIPKPRGEYQPNVPAAAGDSFGPAMIADQISELVNWAEATNVGDGTLSYLDGGTFQLAHDCLTVAPLHTGERANALVTRISDILRTGRQRLTQTRDLYVITGKLCAILSWISSDLGQLPAADAHARNGLALAEQADHNGLRALLLCAQSKNDFWRRRYGDAALLARRGYELNPPGTLRVLLACQEADALQAMGRIEGAKEALARSERAQDAINQGDELGGIFGCGVARQANYSIATHLQDGSPDQALRHVERAEIAWRDGEEWAYGTWAQVQIGAAIARLMGGEIEAASLILQQILDQPEDQRLATLTTRLHREVSPLLTSPAIGRSKFAIMLREGIANYDQSPIRSLPVGGNI